MPPPHAVLWKGEGEQEKTVRGKGKSSMFCSFYLLFSLPLSSSPHPALLFSLSPLPSPIVRPLSKMKLFLTTGEAAFLVCFFSKLKASPTYLSLTPLEKLRHIERCHRSSFYSKAGGRMCWPGLSKSVSPPVPTASLISTCTCRGGDLNCPADGCSSWAILRRKKPAGKEHRSRKMKMT